MNQYLNLIFKRLADFNNYLYHDHGLNRINLIQPFNFDETFDWFQMSNDRPEEEFMSKSWKDQNYSIQEREKKMRFGDMAVEGMLKGQRVEQEEGVTR